jgi:hypothetical protein
MDVDARSTKQQKDFPLAPNHSASAFVKQSGFLRSSANSSKLHFPQALRATGISKNGFF